MKTLTIALKDMGRAFRSFFALAFMFGVPILLTLIFSFLFGGILGEDGEEFSLPKTTVLVVNQDQGSPYIDEIDTEDGPVSNMGELLVQILDDETFGGLMTLTSAEESEARSLVDNQDAGLAVILPPNLTNALIGTQLDQIAIEFYKDPELDLGPQIIQAIVMSLVDDLSAPTLSLNAVKAALKAQGITLSPQEEMALRSTLTDNAEAQEGETTSNLTIIPPTQANPEENSLLKNILRGIMSGMMIFYAFFTGTSAAQTILQEEENGTLARLFITPTPTRTVLNGKFLAGFLMIIVQVLTLIIFSDLVFKIEWGAAFPVIIASVGLVICAACFGIFIMSLIKSTKQAGVMYGGLLTFTGMLGISSVFTGGTPVEEAFKFLPLLVPQGWAMRAYESIWVGNPSQTLLFTGGMLIWAIVFFIIGNARFKKRFA